MTLFSIDTFTSFSSVAVPLGNNEVITAGYSAVGSGGGLYVSDSLATATLAAVHPRLCTPDASTPPRYFRLMPHDGEITPEQAGGSGDIVPTHTIDNRPALQAEINYLVAVQGGGAIVFARPHYSWWQEARTAADNDLYGNGFSGLGFQIDGGHIVFRSNCGGSTLWRRAQSGNDPDVWSNWPLLSGGGVWRGGGIYLKGQWPLPASFSQRSGVTLDNVTFHGGIPRGTSWGNVDVLTGDGWDLTDKGIFCDNHYPQSQGIGDIRLVNNAGIVGFRGELVYGSNTSDSTLYIRGATTGETNAQLLNPNGQKLDILGFRGYNAAFAIEGFGVGSIKDAYFKDCWSGGAFQGGKPTSDPYNAPTRVVPWELPLVHWDAVFENCGAHPNTLNLGYWNVGAMTFRDCGFVIGNSFSRGAKNIDLKITMICDQRAVFPMIATDTTPDTMLVDNVKLDITYILTDEARAASLKFPYPLAYYGSFGPDVIVKATAGPDIFTSIPDTWAAVPDNQPRLEGDMFGPMIETTPWAPPSLSAGSQTTKTISVPGARTGDRVSVRFSLDLQGLVLSGYASAVDTVTAVLSNATTATVAPAAGDLTARVWKA